MKKSKPASERPTLKGDLHLTFKAPAVTFSKDTLSFHVQVESNHEGFTEAFANEPVAFHVSRSDFNTDGINEDEFAGEIGKLYLPLIHMAMRDALRLLLGDAVFIASRTKGPIALRQTDLAGVEAATIEFHTASARRNARFYVRRMLRVPVQKRSKGRPMKWERAELELAIIATLMRIKSDKCRTQACVVREMKKPEHYGQQAPPTVEALRKALTRHKLDWRTLKNEAELRLKAGSQGMWGSVAAETQGIHLPYPE